MKTPTSEILKKKLLTEKEIALLKKRRNAGEQMDIDEPYEITPEQTEKGKSWLLNLWKTPRGIERKTNPFGYREQDALETLEKFTFDGFYDLGTCEHSFYTVIYTVHGKESSFQYIIKSGSVEIIG